MPYAVGVPEPLAQQALLDAAIEFCDETLAVAQTLDPITVPVGMSSVELDTPTGMTVGTVMTVWYDKRILRAVPFAQSVDLFRPDGTPSEYHGEYVDEAYCLNLLPAPDRLVRNGLLVRVGLKPTRAATEVPNTLYDNYADAIVAGALAHLLSIPDQSYTNEPKALEMGRIARAKTTAARVDALHGQVQSSMSVKMRSF